MHRLHSGLSKRNEFKNGIQIAKQNSFEYTVGNDQNGKKIEHNGKQGVSTTTNWQMAEKSHELDKLNTSNESIQCNSYTCTMYVKG